MIGAAGWEENPDNPHQTWVHFIPGEQFQICTRPRDDARTSDGIVILVLRPAERCTTRTF